MPFTVALVVTVVPPDDELVVEDEDEDEDELDTETDETDEPAEPVEVELTEPGLPGLPGVPVTVTDDPGLPVPDAELPNEWEACLIDFSTPCRHSTAANCPDENPVIDTRGPRRHERWPIEIREDPSAEIFPVANCAVEPTGPLAPATPVQTAIAAIATTTPRCIATGSVPVRAQNVNVPKNSD